MPVAFITGGSSGIGQALALNYLHSGWQVALVARRLETMQDWIQSLPNDLSERTMALSADVCDAASLLAAAKTCIEAWGLPDLVVANAGISLGVDTREFEDLAVMDRVLRTNVLGVVHSFHPFVAAMQARGHGTLVAVASVAGIRGLPGHGAYCSSKAAAISYAESLRGELQGSGVRVITLAPGYVATPLTARNRYPMPFLLSADAFAARARRAIERGHGLKVVPWPMAWVAPVLRWLPDRLLDRLFRSQPRKQRHNEA